MTTTMAELRSLAKPKGLMVEYSKGLYNAYIHIQADDTDTGLDGRPPQRYNVCIMTMIDDMAEQAAKEAAKACLEYMPKVVRESKRKRRTKILDNEGDIDDNDASDESLDSTTQTAAKKALTASLKQRKLT